MWKFRGNREVKKTQTQFFQGLIFWGLEACTTRIAACLVPNLQHLVDRVEGAFSVVKSVGDRL